MRQNTQKQFSRPGVLARPVGVSSAKSAKSAKRREAMGRSVKAAGRRLLPSRLEVSSTTIPPRLQRHQASKRVGFPREAFWSDAGFEAARQEPSAYQASALGVPSCPSWMISSPASAPAEPSVYRSASLNEPKLRRSDPVRPLLRSLGINSSTHSINRPALRAWGATSRTGAFADGMASADRWAESRCDSAASRSAAGPTPTVLRPKLHPGSLAVLPSIRFIRAICGPNLSATSRSSRMDLLAGRGRPAYGARHFSYKPLTHRSPASGRMISQLP